MNKKFTNPYQSPYMIGNIQNDIANQTQPLMNTPTDINKIYADIQAMYNQMQNPQPQPVVISQSQEEFFKSKKYSDTMQDFFMGFLINRYGNEFRTSNNYKEFEKWANEEFKKFDEEYNKLKKMEVGNNDTKRNI